MDSNVQCLIIGSMRQSLLENARGFVEAIQSQIFEAQDRVETTGLLKRLLMLAQRTIQMGQVVGRDVVTWVSLCPQLVGLDGLRFIPNDMDVIGSRDIELLSFAGALPSLECLFDILGA